MTPHQHAQHQARRQRRVLHGWRIGTLAVAVIAGGLFITTGLNSGGLDLRAASVTDLGAVVRQQRERTDSLQARVAKLNEEVATLTQGVAGPDVDQLQKQVDQLRGPAGFEPVRGPGLTVVLTDAPKDEINRAIESGDVKAYQLVVHQQDIQAVVNALWAGGAEAMTIQGQRVISTTGIKCVGNTVVLHGVPYAPPYRITAIGSQAALLGSLDDSSFIDAYKTYVEAYHLGYEVQLRPEISMPGYTGSLGLRYAKAGKEPTTGTETRPTSSLSVGPSTVRP